MNKRDRLISFFANIISGLIIAVLLFFLYDYHPEKIVIFAHYTVAIAIFVCASISLIIKSDTLMKITLLVSILAIIIASVYDTLVFTGLSKELTTQEGFQNFLKQYGAQAKTVYFIIQFLQVTILPLPSALTIAAGTAIFGVASSVILSSVAIILGSMFAFFLGKMFGYKLAVWLCGEKNVLKYQQIIKGRDFIIFFLMFLLPFFPDDLLCILAGMTGMSYLSFFIMMLLTRPIGALTVAGSFKSITQIPFKGWGIFVWIALICIFITAIILLLKFSGEIQKGMGKLTDKISAKFKKGKTQPIETIPNDVAVEKSNENMELLKEVIKDNSTKSDESDLK